MIDALSIASAESSGLEGTLLRPELQDPLAPVNWYAAYTSRNHEKKVAAELERRSLTSFLPLYDSVRRWKDRRIKLQVPLFPGYIFVHIPLEERLRVLKVPGVVRIVAFNGCAVSVPETEITRIQDILNRGLRTEPHPYLSVGRRVRVKSGPLLGLQGILLRRKNKLRFVVSMESILRSMAVEMDECDLEPF
jgi:transcription antitermination factor NusG